MAFVYAFLIAGCICALTQCLSNLKVSFSLVAILLMVLGGGLCTKLGFFDWLNALSAAGLTVTAVGCGNGAYNAGVALAAVGTAQAAAADRRAQRDPGWPGRGRGERLHQHCHEGEAGRNG